jgi:hypothetical protein
MLNVILSQKEQRSIPSEFRRKHYGEVQQTSKSYRMFINSAVL